MVVCRCRIYCIKALKSCCLGIALLVPSTVQLFTIFLTSGEMEEEEERKDVTTF